jgi:hypothetical protein
VPNGGIPAGDLRSRQDFLKIRKGIYLAMRLGGNWRELTAGTTSLIALRSPTAFADAFVQEDRWSRQTVMQAKRSGFSYDACVASRP